MEEPTRAWLAMAKKRRKRPRTQLQSQSLLPDDILLEIFQRLPVNSLFRFTTVSKSWSSSIKNPSFISSYQHHHHDDESRSRSHLVFIPHLVLTPHPPYSRVQICSLIPETSIIPNYNPVLKFSESGTVVGSCEGLICFKTTSALYVWNPFIRKSLKKVPACEIPVNTPNKGKLGFGFAPKSRDHRIVNVLCSNNYLSEVEIYSLASDSWRRIKARPSRFTYSKENKRCKVIFNSSHVYWDGSIYWLASKYRNRNRTLSELILKFDLDEEKFEVIAAPYPKYYPGYTLVVIKGFLVILRVRMEFGDRRNIAINMGAYINGKSNSGSSAWIPIPIRISRPERSLYQYHSTMDGHIIVTVIHDGHRSVLIYDGCCDGKNLSFEGRDTKIIIGKESSYGCIIPIRKTLFLLDKK